MVVKSTVKAGSPGGELRAHSVFSMFTRQPDRLSLAHALVGQALIRIGERSSSLASARLVLKCEEIRDRLEECGAQPDPGLSTDEVGQQSPAELLQDALDALEEIPTAQHPPFLDAVWPMIAGVLVELDDSEGTDGADNRR